MSRSARSLGDLRAQRERTQTDVAECIGTTQSAVSRTEHQQDWKLSTLYEYVAATGGFLRLVAYYPDGLIELDLHRITAKAPPPPSTDGEPQP